MEENKLELKIDEETPITIQDFTDINKWETLISSLEKILRKWCLVYYNNKNESSPKSDRRVNLFNTEDKSEQFIYANTTFILKYVSTLEEEEVFNKYYCRTHNDLLSEEYFPSYGNELSVISLYFGAKEYFCIVFNAMSHNDLMHGKEALSALQIALQNNRIEIPSFILTKNSYGETSSAQGYLSSIIMNVNFTTIEYSGIYDNYAIYPTFSSLSNQYFPKEFFGKTEKERSKVSARYTYKASYSNNSLLSYKIGRAHV